MSCDGDDDGLATVQQKATPFGVVDAPAPADHAIQKATAGPATDFDPNDPPEEYADAIEADDFLIYGKASIQQRDLEGQRISVAALEDALDRFFESQDAPGIISRGHADVPVGVPVRAHTLESDATLVIDGERHDFEAGETIRTEAKDADGDGQPELWLASRLANDSDIARETRYHALTGELNGYSVTVKPHEGATKPTAEGEDILSVDLHAVTLGTDEQIRNKGSEFDVAEFKAMLAGQADDARSVAEDLGQRMAATFMGNDTTDEDERSLFSKILRKSADEIEQKADDEGGDEDEGEADEKANPIDTALANGTIEAAQASKIRDVAEKMDDGGIQTLVDAISEKDLDVDEAVEMIESVNGGGMDEPDDEPGDGELKAAADTDSADDDSDADDGGPAEVEQKSDADSPDDDPDGDSDDDTSLDELAAKLDAKLETVEGVGERLDEIEQKLDALDDEAATIEEVKEQVDQKLDAVGEALDSEFESLVQKAEVIESPTPTATGDGGEGPTVRESLGLSGGDR